MSLYLAGLSELYIEIETNGSSLTDIWDRVDFNMIRAVVSDLYKNNIEKGREPDYDPVHM